MSDFGDSRSVNQKSITGFLVPKQKQGQPGSIMGKNPNNDDNASRSEMKSITNTNFSQIKSQFTNSRKMPIFDPQSIPKNQLVRNWMDYFPLDEKPEFFDKDDSRHQMVLLFYDIWECQEFNQQVEFGKSQFQDIFDIHFDFKAIKDLQSLYEQKYQPEHDENTNMYVSTVPGFKERDYECCVQVSDIFNKFFLENPEIILNCLGLAFEKIQSLKIDYNMKMLVKRSIPRIYNFEVFTPLEQIKYNIINNHVTIKGIVLRTSPVRLYICNMKFTCNQCSKVYIKYFQNGYYTPQTTCEDSKCRSISFSIDKTQAKTILYQRIKVQEVEDAEEGTGRVPKKIECELKYNLVGNIISGDYVVINGVLKTEVSGAIKGVNANKKVQGLYDNYIEVNSILNTKSGQKFSVEEEYSDEEINFIEKLSRHPDIYYILIKSVCPTIYGHELVKAGMLLAVVGGSLPQSDELNKKKDDDNLKGEANHIRTDSHVLLIGDPGIGKSQMLKYLADIAPRSVYVCGTALSQAGLTVAVTRDSVTGEHTLEAGALILADQGVCCLDEFDKMQNEHMALLEAMEQQSVSLAKSGILCSLQARTSIIASANPKDGHYNKSKHLKDNIKVSTNAILSRFDLIFLMLDNQDPARDQKLSDHIMKIHNNRKKRVTLDQSQDFSMMEMNRQQQNDQQNKNVFSGVNLYNKPTIINVDKTKFTSSTQYIGEGEYSSLSDLLHKKVSQLPQDCVINQQAMRKYLQYVKKNVHPVLSKGASNIIKQFYCTLRESRNSSNYTIPITTRQLCSLIRLSQARAKLECREVVTVRDAQEIVDMMQESLFDSLEDIGQGPKSNINNMRGMKNVNMNDIGNLSKPKQTNIFLGKIYEQSIQNQSKLFQFSDLMNVAKSMNMNCGDFNNYIEELVFRAHFLNKGNKQFQLLFKPSF